MTNDTQTPDPAVIREKLLDTFTPETLRCFCQDHPQLRPILPYFGLKHNLYDMIDEVITYCDTRDFWDEFLAELSQYDPSQYAPATPIIPTPFNLSAALIAEFDRLLRAGDLLLGAARSEIIPAPDPLDHLQF